MSTPMTPAERRAAALDRARTAVHSLRPLPGGLDDELTVAQRRDLDLAVGDIRDILDDLEDDA